MSIWKRYQPTANAPWDKSRVVHLHRRCVFGGTLSEIERDLNDTPENAVNRVLHGECRVDGVPDDFETMSGLIGQSAADSPNPDRLKAWWIYRCLFSPNPLQERLTWMWHNHFATSNLKVDSLPQMKRQNEILRNHANRNFVDLLRSVVQDPAMLIWLDAPSNRAGHPNENLARELMELFTLGIGHYSEADVKNAARALTGLNVRDGEYKFEERRHDAEEKTILGKTSSFNTDQLLETLVNHPATAERLARRLTLEFFGENFVSDAALGELAQQLTDSRLDIQQALETILHSELFFAQGNINSRISDPLSFLILPLRVLEIFNPPPSTILLADWLRKLGLELFYPPNVGGWDSGRSWLTTRAVIGRTNYIAAVVSGQIHNPVQPPDLTRLINDESNKSRNDFLGEIGLLLRGEVNETESASAGELPRSGATEIVDPHARAIIQLMAQPRAHLH